MCRHVKEWKADKQLWGYTIQRPHIYGLWYEAESQELWETQKNCRYKNVSPLSCLFLTNIDLRMLHWSGSRHHRILNEYFKDIIRKHFYKYIPTESWQCGACNLQMWCSVTGVEASYYIMVMVPVKCTQRAAQWLWLNKNRKAMVKGWVVCSSAIVISLCGFERPCATSPFWTIWGWFGW